MLDIDDALFKIAVPGHYQDLLKNLPTVNLRAKPGIDGADDDSGTPMSCCTRLSTCCNRFFGKLIFYGGLWLVFTAIFGLTVFEGWAHCNGKIFYPDGNPFDHFAAAPSV